MEKNKILVTGATGFIGRRLVPALLARGYAVRCLSRRPDAVFAEGAEAAQGDLRDPETLAKALKGIDTAYYLVHALNETGTSFARRDRQAAENFVAAAEPAGLRRTIYLGGLGETEEQLSQHLASRAEVGRILQRSRFATTVLRAAVIIGAGGASFEIIRSLVKRLPLMAVPMSIDTPCQPIAVRDVIRYLVGCLEVEETAGETFDICGTEVLTYHQMMERFARVAGEVNLYFPIPFLSPRLFAYGVGLTSSIKASVAIPLIRGLKNPVICHDHRLQELIPFELTPYDEAVREALTEHQRG